MEQYYIIPKSTIDDIEDSIQRKRGSVAPIEPSEMPLAIDTIPSSIDGTDLPVGGIYLTKPDSNGNPTELLIIGIKPNIETSWFGAPLTSYSYYPYISKIHFIDCDNFNSVPQDAFRSNNVIVSVILPDSLKSIDYHSFFRSQSIESVLGSNSLTTIGVEAFYACESLRIFYFPKTLSTIGSGAFRLCTSLENVTIENGFNCNSLDLSASTLYSVETIVSWLEALADRTGQAAFTLTIGATNLNKLTAEQKAIATNKNWTLA